ncbi:hypothetical protein ACFPPD_17840 [Cohnella suwonensis]|uniref:DUF3502 domain-containing protein n=1 Tax=Cohnella suwonensis TaxID=696072 RepID=A0ABW0M056_9BACL
MNLRFKATTGIIALTLLLAGCGSKSGGEESPSASPSPSPSASPSASFQLPSESPSESPSADPGVSILKDFVQLASQGPAVDELYGKLKTDIGQVKPEQADEMIRELEKYYESDLPVLEKKYEADDVQAKLIGLKWPIDEKQVDGLKDDSLSSLVHGTLEGGYKLETAEGFIFPVVDYGKLTDYSAKTTEAMSAYLDVRAAESDNPSASDGGLIISLDELASRTLAAESYVVAFPDSPEREAIEQTFVNYLQMYLIGLDNTPIFDWETFHLLPDTKKQFEQTVADHGGTVTGKMTKQLLDVLAETKGAVFVEGIDGMQEDVPAVKQFRDKLESTARALLPTGKK